MTLGSASALYANWLGYLNIALSATALAAASAALVWRRDQWERWVFPLLLGTAATTVVATLIALSLYAVVRTPPAFYVQFFIAATLFTLLLALACWRQLNQNVLWSADTRWLYLFGLASCVGLATTLVWMG